MAAPGPSTDAHGAPAVCQPPFWAPGRICEENRQELLSSFYSLVWGRGQGPSGPGERGGQGQAVWGHYLRARKQGCVCVCVSVSGWSGVSRCVLGDHIRVGRAVGTSAGSVSRREAQVGGLCGSLGGVGAGGFCRGGVVEVVCVSSAGLLGGCLACLSRLAWPGGAMCLRAVPREGSAPWSPWPLPC